MQTSFNELQVVDENWLSNSKTCSSCQQSLETCQKQLVDALYKLKTSREYLWLVEHMLILT